MPDGLHFYFLEPRHPNAANSADVIQSVKEMVARVLFQLAQSGGKIGKITFDSHASRGTGFDGYFYIGLDEISHSTINQPLDDQSATRRSISHSTINQHARDLTRLAPHFAPDAEVMVYGSCGSIFNDMAKYMLSNFWPGVSVRTMSQRSCHNIPGNFRGSYRRHGHNLGYQGWRY